MYDTIKLDIEAIGKLNIKCVGQFEVKGEYGMKRICCVFLILILVGSIIQGCDFQKDEKGAEDSSSFGVERDESSENQGWVQMRESINDKVQDARSKSEPDNLEVKIITKGEIHSTLIKPRCSYQTESGEEYLFNEKQQLVHYSGNDEQKDMGLAAGTRLTPEEACQLFMSLYKEQISQLEDFELVKYYEYGDRYELFMDRPIDEYLSDSILVNISKTGEVLWFHVYYCDMDRITDAQRQQLEELLKEYIEQHQSRAIDYDASVSYCRLGDMILAHYSVIYQYAEGAEYGELFNFAIEG